MSFRRTCRLLSATEKQDNEKIKKCIKSGSTYDEVDLSSNTLLHHAAKAGNHEIVQYLVDAGCKIDVRNNHRETPLVRCLKTNTPCKKVIRILLEAGANIFLKDKLGKSALRIVDSSMWLGEDTDRFEIYKMFLESASNLDDFNLLEIGSVKIIKKLLQTNIDPTAFDSKGNTLVHILARNRNSGIMEFLQCCKEIDINKRDGNWWTPLMHAAFNGAVGAVKFLLDEGADIEATELHGRTVLYLVYDSICKETFDKKNFMCIQRLLELGANVQVEVARFSLHTIFDMILEFQFEKDTFCRAGELALAQLAFQEANGTEIIQLIRSKIESHDRFKTYFEYCQQQLAIKIYKSVKLIDILSSSDWKLESYLCDKELASKIASFQTEVDYFDTILSRRLSRAFLMIGLRKTAAPIVCNLMRISYDSYPFIAAEIVCHLDEKDIKCLTSIQNELDEYLEQKLSADLKNCSYRKDLNETDEQSDDEW